MKATKDVIECVFEITGNTKLPVKFIASRAKQITDYHNINYDDIITTLNYINKKCSFNDYKHLMNLVPYNYKRAIDACSRAEVASIKIKELKCKDEHPKIVVVNLDRALTNYIPTTKKEGFKLN